MRSSEACLFIETMGLMGLVLLLWYTKYVMCGLHLTYHKKNGTWHLILNQEINLSTVIAVLVHPVQPVQNGEDILRFQVQVSVPVLEILTTSLSSAVLMARGQCPQVECYLALKHKQPRRYDCHDNMNIDAE